MRNLGGCVVNHSLLQVNCNEEIFPLIINCDSPDWSLIMKCARLWNLIKRTISVSLLCFHDQKQKCWITNQVQKYLRMWDMKVWMWATVGPNGLKTPLNNDKVAMEWMDCWFWWIKVRKPRITYVLTVF